MLGLVENSEWLYMIKTQPNFNIPHTLSDGWKITFVNNVCHRWLYMQDTKEIK